MASHDIDIEETSSTNSESLTSASETTHTISKPDSDFPVLNTKTIVMSDSNQNQLTRDKTMQICSGSEGDFTLDVDSLPPSSNQQKRVRKTSVTQVNIIKICRILLYLGEICHGFYHPMDGVFLGPTMIRSGRARSRGTKPATAES